MGIYSEFEASGDAARLAEALANSEFLVYIGGINNISRFHESIINGDDDWLSVDDE